MTAEVLQGYSQKGTGCRSFDFSARSKLFFHRLLHSRLNRSTETITMSSENHTPVRRLVVETRLARAPHAAGTAPLTGCRPRSRVTRTHSHSSAGSQAPPTTRLGSCMASRPGMAPGARLPSRTPRGDHTRFRTQTRSHTPPAAPRAPPL